MSYQGGGEGEGAADFYRFLPPDHTPLTKIFLQGFDGVGYPAGRILKWEPEGHKKKW